MAIRLHILPLGAVTREKQLFDDALKLPLISIRGFYKWMNFAYRNATSVVKGKYVNYTKS